MLNSEINRLRAVEDAFLNDRPLPTVSATIERSAPGRESVLLDLAIDVLAGRVVGLDANRLATLREVA